MRQDLSPHASVVAVFVLFVDQDSFASFGLCTFPYPLDAGDVVSTFEISWNDQGQ